MRLAFVLPASLALVVAGTLAASAECAGKVHTTSTTPVKPLVTAELPAPTPAPTTTAGE